MPPPEADARETYHRPTRAGHPAWLPIYVPASLTQRDWLVALALGIVAAGIALLNHAVIDPIVYRTFNIYFQADPPRVISNLTDRWSHFQNRNVAHPLFSIFGVSTVKGAGFMGLPPMRAIAALLAIMASASVGSFFLAMRGLALPVKAAAGFTLAYMSGAAFLHWYAFPETYAASATTITLMIAVLACARSSSLWLWVIGSAATLSMLITNWSLALAAAALRLRVRSFVIVTLAAFVIVASLSLVQHRLLLRARFFLDPVGIAKEHTFSGPEMRRVGMRWNAGSSLLNGLVTPIVVPEPEVVHEPTEQGVFTMVTNQFVPLAAFGWNGAAVVALWVALLAAGVSAVIVEPRLRRFGLPLMAYAGFQVAFHTVYGEIAFLYAADTLPVMMALAALGWFSPWRRGIVPLLVLFVPLAATVNETRFLAAARLSHAIAVAKTEGRAFGF